jgi:hypothetical protein
VPQRVTPDVQPAALPELPDDAEHAGCFQAPVAGLLYLVKS